MLISPVWRVVGAALLFSTGGAAIKTGAFSGMQVASLRSGIAALALILWVRGGARWSWRVLPVAIVYAATLVLFVMSTKLTTAASAIFLQSTAPLYIVVLAPLLLRERFDRRDLLFVSAAAVGLAFCFLGQPAATTTAPDPLSGNLLGAACSVTWAFTLLGLRWGERRAPGTALASVVAGNVLAFASGIPALLPLPAASPAEWLTLVYLGLFQIALAYILLTSAVGHLPALHISLLLLLEPVLNPIWTWLVHGEDPGAWTLVGGAIVIIASAAQATFGPTLTRQSNRFAVPK
jgi:drug/metabolite transporter (DMT)-like permease